ncbi:MAG: LytR C-terminal domain-containing protein [Spirochaetota bacterium]
MKNKIAIISISLAAIVIFLFIFLFYKKNTRNAVDNFVESRKMINILIAGSNVYKKNKHIFYAILSINPEKSKIGITFIPPEYRVDFNGKGKNFNKISEININDFNDLSKSLGRDLKINIPFYVVLYSPDVERFIDLINGIELYVLDGMNIHGINFGLNYFNGDKVNQYINSVEENSIYKKYDRIQNILLTLFYNKEKYEKFFNIEFISEIIKTVKTNLLPQEILSLTKLLRKKNSDLICTVLPGFSGKDGFYAIDEIAYKIYSKEFLRKLVVDDESEQQVKVKILNGTDVAGLARKIRYKFVTQGFNVLEFGTAPYPAFEKTVIINRRGEIGPVKKVADLLGVTNIYHIVDSSQLTNVLIIIGSDLAKYK